MESNTKAARSRRRTYDDSHRSQSRSRSPKLKEHSGHLRRDRSPHRSHQHHSHHHRHHREKSPVRNITLPCNARPLVKGDYRTFKPMFASYLDIQKGRILEELDEVEQRGRWKSFLKKWNRGELAEGWYDPMTLRKAIESEASPSGPAPYRARSIPNEESRDTSRRLEKYGNEAENSESDDSIGPALPGQRKRTDRAGPSVPGFDDIQFKRERAIEKAAAQREAELLAKKAYRKEQKEALDELVPRAEGGTRERQLEKKMELNEKMKSFRERSPGGEDMADSTLMGGGDEISDFKKQKQEMERRKNERELRREEISRAKAAETEERLAEYRKKEAVTVDMLKALAKQRFG